jgi:cytosine/creatinine deaminase
MDNTTDGSLPPKLSRSAALRRELLSATTRRLDSGDDPSSSSAVIQFLNVSIPIAVLPKDVVSNNNTNVVSEEGLVLCHLWVKGSKIQKVALAAAAEEDVGTSTSPSVPCSIVDCQRSIVMPCFVDCHTHLDKTLTVTRTRNRTGTMEEAWLQNEPTDWQYWTVEDLRLRMEFAVKCAIHHGTKALRTHLDGYNCGEDYALEERLRNAVYEAYKATRERFQDQIILQAVANLYLPLYQTHPELARAHCKRAKDVPGTVLGAYIGNTADTPETETIQHFDAMLAWAAEFEMDVDLHIDESNDPRCCALKPLVASLTKARRNGYQGKVVLGHCCALSLQDDDTKHYICQQLAALGNVYVVANPFTNLSLQDRRGTSPPLGVEIPADVPRTPQWRGLTLLQELRASGVAVATASDNVRDFWLSAGSDYDMLSVWSITQTLCHLDTAPNEGSWADIVTSNPAKAMGILQDPASPFGVDEAADFILFPGARYASELFSRPHHDRIVIREGRVLQSALPDYAELDDLLLEKKGSPQRKPKGETENLLELLGLLDNEQHNKTESHHHGFTTIPHFYQLETWDCGTACLMMVWKWLQSDDSIGTSESSLHSSILTPRDLAARRKILGMINTESIWTSDLVWILHQWRVDGDKDFRFVLVSKNIDGADQQYENYEYYRQAFEDDQPRVSETFQKLQREGVSMIEIERMLFPAVMDITSRHMDVVAIMLVDNNVLLKKQKLADETFDALNINCYAGHYVILCGTSDKPQHVQDAKSIMPDDLRAASEMETDLCCVLANPDPSSTGPFQFVLPHHLEAAWRSSGTDDDIIFLHKCCSRSMYENIQR